MAGSDPQFPPFAAPPRPRAFRVRQAARGSINISPTNHGTLGIFNNASVDRVIVVRDWVLSAATGMFPPPVGFTYYQGMPGAVGGTVNSIDPTAGAIAGQLWSLDTTLTYNLDYCVWGAGNGAQSNPWVHEYPFALLPPGWSLLAQNPDNGSATALSVIWEAVKAEDIDYLY